MYGLLALLWCRSRCVAGVPFYWSLFGSSFLDAPRGEGYRYCERDKSQAQHDLGETAVLLLKGKENVHFKGQLGRHCGTEVPSINRQMNLRELGGAPGEETASLLRMGGMQLAQGHLQGKVQGS